MKETEMLRVLSTNEQKGEKLYTGMCRYLRFAVFSKTRKNKVYIVVVMENPHGEAEIVHKQWMSKQAFDELVAESQKDPAWAVYNAEEIIQCAKAIEDTT